MRNICLIEDTFFVGFQSDEVAQKPANTKNYSQKE
jgi:hypothetical protein